ncbi:MAG: putative toxin-antitoxin system toxin component, PIN family [Candidatus Aminicenantes bacterium]|nr:MAG: putative toxin-antitoxin system toxin component, PIN family [Candidatus Aminicenantes bacterium]
MRLVVDTNIIFSALLKKGSNALDIIMSDKFEVFIPKFLIIEIFKHKEKIIRVSKLSEDEVIESLYLILKYCTVMNDEDIPGEILNQAFQDVKEIDPKDVIFVAAAITLDARLWSGDKKLINGLKDKNSNIFVRTKDLVEFFKKQEQAGDEAR